MWCTWRGVSQGFSHFHGIIFKVLTFQAIKGYMSMEVFSFCRIVFLIKKSLARFLSTVC